MEEIKFKGNRERDGKEVYGYYCFFFFSSRRRHTRYQCDWSSDVCSSDLAIEQDKGLCK